MKSRRRRSESRFFLILIRCCCFWVRFCPHMRRWQQQYKNIITELIPEKNTTINWFRLNNNVRCQLLASREFVILFNCCGFGGQRWRWWFMQHFIENKSAMSGSRVKQFPCENYLSFCCVCCWFEIRVFSAFLSLSLSHTIFVSFTLCVCFVICISFLL